MSFKNWLENLSLDNSLIYNIYMDLRSFLRVWRLLATALDFLFFPNSASKSRNKTFVSKIDVSMSCDQSVPFTLSIVSIDSLNKRDDDDDDDDEDDGDDDDDDTSPGPVLAW